MVTFLVSVILRTVWLHLPLTFEYVSLVDVVEEVIENKEFIDEIYISCC